MAIVNAVQRGPNVYVYDEQGRNTFVQFAGGGPKDGLRGYTGGSVNIQRGTTMYTYNEKGQNTHTTFAG